MLFSQNLARPFRPPTIAPVLRPSGTQNPHLILTANGTFILYFRVNDMDTYGPHSDPLFDRVPSYVMSTSCEVLGASRWLPIRTKPVQRGLIRPRDKPVQRGLIRPRDKA